MRSDRGGVTLAFVILAIAILGGFALVFGACDALFDDENEKDDLGWAPVAELARDRDRGDDCDGSCGNQHRDCENNPGECSDDDQLVIAPVICVEPDSCRFG